MRLHTSLLIFVISSGCIEDDRRLADTATTSQPTTSETDTNVADTGVEDTTSRPDVPSCQGCTISGACIPNASSNPANPCQYCDLAKPNGWTAADDKRFCDDGNACHIDGECKLGQCVTRLAEGDACRPECVKDATCIGEQCQYELEKDTCLIAGRCQDKGPSLVNACLLCSPDEHALAWTPKNCADSLECTLDSCEGGNCAHDLLDGYCSIDNQCIIATGRKVDNECLVCDPDAFHTDWTVDEGYGCVDGDECTGQDKCNGDAVCSGDLIITDPGSNNTMENAQPLGDSFVSTYPQSKIGNINPATDVDWFWWRQVLSALGKTYRPHAALVTTELVPLQLCVLVTCEVPDGEMTEPTIGCPNGATSMSVDTAKGCCVTGTTLDQLDLSLEASCVTASPVSNARVHARISFPGVGSEPVSQCAGYQLKWGASEAQ